MAETTPKKDPKAPHGFAEDGVTPLAPYGWKTDGTPRISRRGRTSAKKPGTPAAGGTRASRARAEDQKTALLQLADALLSPAMAAASNPGVARKIGERRAAGLAGSLVIIDGYVPAYVDQVVALSQTKPGLLAWMDRMEDSAPYMGLAIVTAQMVKAVTSNMIDPSPELERAARTKARVRAAQMALAIQQEAAQYGVVLEEEEAPREHPQEQHEEAVAA